MNVYAQKISSGQVTTGSAGTRIILGEADRMFWQIRFGNSQRLPIDAMMKVFDR